MRTLLPLTIVALALAIASPASAVVGGTAAPPGRYPWMTALLYSDVADPAWAQFCGGVVIAPRRVLTAGHCVIGQPSSSVQVLIGQTRLTGTGGRRIAVRSISIAPGFADRTRPNADAAVLELAKDAGVPPVALSTALPPPGPATVMGWGVLNARLSQGKNVYYADQLREVSEPVQNDATCEGVYGIGYFTFPYLPQWVLCGGTGDGHTGACRGDSGGPLVVQAPEGWVDVGILHGGDACASPGYYDLFVRTDAVRGFALGTSLARQPELLVRPKVTGRIAVGARVSCSTGRWRGDATRFDVQWQRAGTKRVLANGRTYTLTRSDARRGVRCRVTASGPGGRGTGDSYLSRPSTM